MEIDASDATAVAVAVAQTEGYLPSPPAYSALYLLTLLPPPIDAARTQSLSRSDKIALGVGLGVRIPSAISGVIVIYQACMRR